MVCIGYINQNGEVVIDFQYDYASPFIKITEYNKEFYVALVCKDGRTTLILKNGREVLSYRSESNDENYGAKLEELEDIYTNTLGQPGDMETEIEAITDNKNKVEAYAELSSDDYTYRYDYNDEYDLIVTQSNMGLGDKYELAKKDDLSVRMEIDAGYLDYDSKYLYLYSNGTIPFYEISKRTQGWITAYGARKEVTGKAQILEFFGERILIRDYTNGTIYFINNSTDGTVLSEYYYDIYVCRDGRYIVRTSDNFFKVIDEDYNKVFEKEYASINPRLIASGLYLGIDSLENIKFNDYGYAENMSWQLLNSNGDVIFEGIEQIYDLCYKLPTDKEIEEENYLEFVEDVRELEYNFVGDKFYQDY